jgi:hypothetical protein
MNVHLAFQMLDLQIVTTDVSIALQHSLSID